MTISPEGPGLSLLTVSIVLLIFSWIAVGLRTMVRCKIKAFGLDDWLMGVGLVFFTIACASTILAAFNGVGAHADRLNEYYNQQGRKWFMFYQLFYVASTVPIKSAICVALLRITNVRLHRIVLYAIIGLSLIAAITTDVAVLAQCRPIAATWNPTLGKCAPPSVITGVSYFISASAILTDWACAILPAFILWDVQMRLRIKASVAIVLALGVVASSATIVRLPYLLKYSSADDYLYGIADMAVWSITESGVGIIAGSLATLRPLLRYVPFLSQGSSSGPSKPTTGNHTSSHKLDVLSRGRRSTKGFASGSYHVRTECEADRRQDWEELSDGASQKYILKESKVVVTSEAGSTNTGGDLEDGGNLSAVSDGRY